MEIFKVFGSVFLKDEATKGLESIDGKAGKTGLNFSQMGEKVGKVGGTLTKWVTGPAMLAGGALLALASKTGDYADRILDLSDITGMSTDAIQGWQYVAGQAGVSTEAVTNASQKLTKQMTLMEKGTGKQAEALGKLGIKFEDLEKASPDERMEMVTAALQGIEDPAERAQLGTDLLGGAFADLAPIVGMSAEELDEMRKKGEELGLDEDALQSANEFRKGMQNLKDEFAAAFREIAIKFLPLIMDNLVPFLQGSVIPAIQSFVEKIGQLIDWFSNLSPTMQKVILSVMAFFVALGPVLIVIGKIMVMIPILVKVFGVLAGAITWPVVAIVALIAAGVLLWKNWDKIMAWAKKLKDKVVAYIGKLRDDAVKAFNNLKDRGSKAITDLRSSVLSRVNQLRDSFTNAITTLRQRVIDRFNAIRDSVVNTVNKIKDRVTSTIDSMRTNAVNRFNSLKDGATNAVNTLRNSVSNTFGKIKDAIINPINTARDRVKTVIDNIKSWFSGLKLKLPALKFPPIKMPKFDITGKFGLTPPSVPKLSLKWFKTGGVMQDPFTVGNAGFGDVAEAIVPFEGPHAKKIARLIADNMPGKGQTINFYSPKALTSGEMIRKQEQLMRKLAMEYGV